MWEEQRPRSCRWWGPEGLYHYPPRRRISATRPPLARQAHGVRALRRGLVRRRLPRRSKARIAARSSTFAWEAGAGPTTRDASSPLRFEEKDGRSHPAFPSSRHSASVSIARQPCRRLEFAVQQARSHFRRGARRGAQVCRNSGRGLTRSSGCRRPAISPPGLPAAPSACYFRLPLVPASAPAGRPVAVFEYFVEQSNRTLAAFCRRYCRRCR